MTSGPNSGIHASAVDYDPFAAPELARAVPTTEAQREVWLADHLGSEASLAFNEAVVLSMRGPLEVAALEQALQALCERHESMRATFSEDGQMMLIEAHGTLQPQWLDFSAMPQAQQDAALQSLQAQAVRQPFDLLHGPLFRVTVIQQGGGGHSVLLAAHHIVCDGWSFGVLARELMVLYSAAAKGQQPAQSPLSPPDRFGDYALAERSSEGEEKQQSDERYWLSVYGASVPTLDLPADRPRPARRGFASQREDLRLEPELVEAIRRLGAANGVSLFAGLLGIFAAMIARLGGERESVVGVPAAGQSEAGLDALVGHCVQLLPVRMDLTALSDVGSLLRASGAQVLDAYDHQGCTLGRLLSKLHLGRDGGRMPLVSVQFNLDAPIPDQVLSKGGLQVGLRTVARAFENFEIFINAVQIEGAVVLECQYSSTLFERQTVLGWLALYRTALQRAVQDPAQQIDALFAAGPQDLASLAGWNQTAAEFPRQLRVESLVSQQASRTPGAVALTVGSESLTYAELEARANGLALALIAQGVGCGQYVGMGCGRNAHMLVALLGILKTGAAYVPLDPSFPAERLAHMRRDAALRWIVADRSVEWEEQPGVSVLWVEDVVTAAQGPALVTDTAAPAYVIYTSGSTGLPKGVMVPHGAVVNFLHSMARAPGLQASDRLLAVTTISFDIAVLELFCPLMVGAEVILADRDTVMDGIALRRLLESRQATVMQATPSGWRLLIDAGWEGGSHFKALVGGEALPEDLAGQLLQRTGQTWNMYGPTETTVWSTVWPVPAKRQGLRIGQPIANTVVRVLDEQQRVCPIGVSGEIYIGGDGVAIGYLNRPELTAERFLEDPLNPGRRLYRTGDRGRWRNDGTIEHLGRLDHQVKVRGYRIELGEIEVQLSCHPDVAQAVVITREDQPGDVRLVAYLVVRNTEPSARALEDHLRLTLPPYMLPQHFVVVDTIPLLPNGKINRKALPDPRLSGAANAAPVAPADALEASVVGTMQEILANPALGVDEDFFRAGGHSLLAAQLATRLARRLERAVPMRLVFEHPSARELAAALRRDEVPARAPVQRHLDQRQALLTTMQDSVRFMADLYPGRLAHNMPSAHRLTGAFDADAFGRAFDALVARNGILRTYLDRNAAQPTQRVLDRVQTQLELIDLQSYAASEREGVLMHLMEEETNRPIAIGQAPLFRARLYRLAPAEHVFFFMPHHLIWDGWSFDLLYNEMSELYVSALNRKPPAPVPADWSYFDFAHWQAQWLQSDECQQQLRWWKALYANVHGVTALKLDHGRRASGITAVHTMQLDRALLDRMHQVAAGVGATVNMVLMAAYGALLRQSLDGDTVILGLPVRGRMQTEFESVMGRFVNTVGLPLKVDLELGVEPYLAHVRQALAAALAQQDVPFEHVSVEPEFAAHFPVAGLYHSMFSFQDARGRPTHWGPLRHGRVDIESKGASVRLGLWLLENDHGLVGAINYDEGVFDAATIAVLARRLEGLLRRLVDLPTGRLQDVLQAHGQDATDFAAIVDGQSSVQLNPDAAAQASAAAGVNGPADLQSGLARIWESLIGLEMGFIVGEDNFFDLGGNSLMAMRAIAQAQQELGLRTEPRHYVTRTLQQIIANAGIDNAPNVQLAEVAIPATDTPPTLARGGLLTRLWGRK